MYKGAWKLNTEVKYKYFKYVLQYSSWVKVSLLHETSDTSCSCKLPGSSWTGPETAHLRRRVYLPNVDPGSRADGFRGSVCRQTQLKLVSTQTNCTESGFQLTLEILNNALTLPELPLSGWTHLSSAHTQTPREPSQITFSPRGVLFWRPETRAELADARLLTSGRRQSKIISTDDESLGKKFIRSRCCCGECVFRISTVYCSSVIILLLIIFSQSIILILFFCCSYMTYNFIKL